MAMKNDVSSWLDAVAQLTEQVAKLKETITRCKELALEESGAQRTSGGWTLNGVYVSDETVKFSSAWMVGFFGEGEE